MLPSVSLVTDFRWRQNEAKTKKWHTRCSRVYHWCLKINHRWRRKVMRPKKSLIFLLHVSTESPLFYSFKKRQNAASLLHYIFNEKPSKCARTQVSIIPRQCICDDNKWLLYNCHHSCQLRPLYFDSKTAQSISLCKEKKSMQTCNSQDLIVNSPF